MADSPEEFLAKNGLRCERLNMKLTAQSCYQVSHRKEPHSKCLSCKSPLYTTVPDFVPPPLETSKRSWGFGASDNFTKDISALSKKRKVDPADVDTDYHEERHASARSPVDDSTPGEDIRDAADQTDISADSPPRHEERQGSDDSDGLLPNPEPETQDPVEVSSTPPRVLSRPDSPTKKYTAVEFAKLCGVSATTFSKAKRTVEEGRVYDSHGKTSKVVSRLQEMGLTFDDLIYHHTTNTDHVIHVSDIVRRPQERKYSVKEIGEMAGVGTREVWNAISRYYQNGSTGNGSFVYKVFEIFRDRGITPEDISIRRRISRVAPSDHTQYSKGREISPISVTVNEDLEITVPDVEQYKDAPISPAVGLILSKIPLEGLLWEIRRRLPSCRIILE